jgi:hypothetical protein
LTPFPGDDPSFVTGLRGDSGLDVLFQNRDSVELALFQLTEGRLSNQPVVLASGGLSNGADAALLPSLSTVVLAADPPAASAQAPSFREFSVADGSLVRTYSIPGKGHPNAVAVTSAGLGMIAGGAESDGPDDVWVYRIGQLQPAWSADLGSSGIRPFPRGIAWSHDGTSLFVVAGDPSKGLALLFVLHPFSDPSSTSASPTPVTSDYRNVEATGQASPRSSEHLPRSALVAGALIGGLITCLLPLFVHRRSKMRHPGAWKDRGAIRAERLIASILEPGEQVTVAVRAVRTPDSESARTVVTALLLTLVLVATLLPKVSIGVGLLILLTGEVALIALSRRVMKRQEVVLTERRLVVRDLRTGSKLPESILGSIPLGVALRADVSESWLSAKLSLSTPDGTSTFRVPALGRDAALRLRDAVEQAALVDSPNIGLRDAAPAEPVGSRRRGMLEGAVIEDAVGLTTQDRTAAALIALAGALALLSHALPWAHLTYPRDQTTLSIATVGHGIVPLVSGGFLLLRALMYLSQRNLGVLRRLRRSTLISAGILGAYAFIYLSSEPNLAYRALAKNTAVKLVLPLAQVQAVINTQVAIGVTRFDVSSGFFVNLLAVCCAVVGALVLRSTTAGPSHPRAGLPAVDRPSFSMLGSITPGFARVVTRQAPHH